MNTFCSAGLVSNEMNKELNELNEVVEDHKLNQNWNGDIEELIRISFITPLE